MGKLPHKSPLVLGELGVRHRMRSNVLLPPIPRVSSRQLDNAAARSREHSMQDSLAAAPQVDAETVQVETAATAAEEGSGLSSAAQVVWSLQADAAAKLGCSPSPAQEAKWLQAGATAALSMQAGTRAGAAAGGRSGDGACVEASARPASALSNPQPTTEAAAAGYMTQLNVPKSMLPAKDTLTPFATNRGGTSTASSSANRLQPGTASHSPCQVLVPATLLLHPLPLASWQEVSILPSLIWRLEGKCMSFLVPLIRLVACGLADPHLQLCTLVGLFPPLYLDAVFFIESGGLGKAPITSSLVGVHMACWIC